LLDQIEDLLGQAGVGEWVGLWVYVSLISHFVGFRVETGIGTFKGFRSCGSQRRITACFISKT
jgi:hypothetical protein